MKQQLFIRLEADLSLVSWLRRGELRIEPQLQRGSLADAAAAAIGAEVVVLLPAEDVLLTQVTIPGKKSRNVLMQAVPYALEEQLAGDVENLHFALGPVEGDSVNVAVVAKKQMDHWNEALAEAGLQADVLMSEAQALPLESGCWSLLALPQSSLLRSGQNQAMGFDLANTSVMLQATLAQAGDAKPEALVIYETPEQHLELPELEIEQRRAPVSGGVLHLMAQHAEQGINLLQGGYSRRERMGQYWRPWKVPAALAASLLVLQVGISTMDYSRLQAQNEVLKAQIVASYQKAFPQEKNVPYPQKQMEQHLRKLTRSGGDAKVGGGGFSELLAQAGREIKDDKNVQLQRLSFKDGVLDIALSIGDLQQLDKLKQRLVDKGEMTVEIVSAASRGPKVEARLRISEGKS